MIEAKDTRIAVVGAGYWGKNLVRNFGELGVLAAVVDPNVALASELAAKFSAVAIDFESALTDASINGIAIAAPAHLHFDLVKRALLAGKHVFVEKPITLKSSEAQELIALAQHQNLRLMVGHLLQYHPAFLKLKEIVQSGTLGKIQYLYSNRLSLGKIRQEEDVLWSFAPHDLSMILALAGEAPAHVSAFGAQALQPDIADFAQVHLEFPSGLKGHVFVSWLHPFKEQKLVVVGEKGMVVFEDSHADRAQKLMFYPHQVGWKNGALEPVKGDGAPIDYENSEPLRNECQHFLDCIANGTTPRTDGQEGLRVLDVLTKASAMLNVANRTMADKSSQPSKVSDVHAGVTIHESAYVDAGVTIGEGTKIWHFSHILGQTTLGRKVSVGQNVVIGPKVSVGDFCKIQNNVSLYEGVILEQGVFCGPSCVFTNVNNPRAEIERKSEYRTTLVKRGASIGANATIVCGHTLGEYCFIAAGAVVARDVPAFAMMAGVPARRMGWMSRAGHKLGKDLVCPGTGERYRETADGLLELA